MSGSGDREGKLALALISVAVGLVLAVAYHFLSMSLQSWVAQRNSALLPLVTVLGFVLRLAFVVAVLVILALFTPLNVLALCLAFVVVFTILTGFSLYRLLTNRHTTPPPANAGRAQ